MSNNRLTILIVVAVLLLSALFGYWYHISKPKYNWSEEYRNGAYTYESAEPYGVSILYNLLDEHLDERLLLGDSLDTMPIDSNAQSSYFFVGPASGRDSAEVDYLLSYVAAGNTAFIASKGLSPYLIKHLYHIDCDSVEWEGYDSEYSRTDTFQLRLYETDQPEYPVFLSRQNETQQWYRLQFIPYDLFYCEDTQDYESLGCAEEDYQVNFARFGYGKGQFYFHSTPLALTNFHLLRPEGKEYCQKLLSVLPEGKVYWDNKYKTNPSNINWNSGNRKFNKNPLATLLSNRAMAWAWYLSLGLGALYVLFKGKRRQRTIPILPKNSNTSMEFVETIAQLHFKQQNFRGIAIQRMKLFLAHLRERYGVHIQQGNGNHIQLSDESHNRLQKLTELPTETIDAIFSQYAIILGYEATEEEVTALYRAIEQFKIKAK